MRLLLPHPSLRSHVVEGVFILAYCYSVHHLSSPLNLSGTLTYFMSFQDCSSVSALEQSVFFHSFSVTTRQLKPKSSGPGLKCDQLTNLSSSSFTTGILESGEDIKSIVNGSANFEFLCLIVYVSPAFIIYQPTVFLTLLQYYHHLQLSIVLEKSLAVPRFSSNKSQ